jgi:nucleotidyltransferase substrate binding protein (TIGR01987 family)
MEDMNLFKPSDKERRLDSKLKWKISQFDKALSTLLGAINETAVNEYVEDSIVQRFEYTYELAWGTLKTLLETKGLVLRFPSEIYSEAFMAGWIENAEDWKAMTDDRNLTSHEYKELYVARIRKDIREIYSKRFQFLANKLKEMFK